MATTVNKGYCICGCGSCAVPGTWRIVDQDSIIYAEGPVTVVLGENPYLQLVPEPFTPTFYYTSAGNKNFRLEVDSCGGDWSTLEEWSGDITLCSTISDRYPQHAFSTPFSPPAGTPCECWNFVKVQAGLEQCDPCLPFQIGSNGTGQEWRDPQPGPAVTFGSFVDGEWTNLANWEDADGNTPAGSLPDAASEVFLEASVTSSSVEISVKKMTIEASGEFHVAATVDSLVCHGAVGRSSICDGVYGSVTVTVDCEFDGGTLEGEVTATGLAATFINGGNVTAAGVVNGNAVFDGMPGTDNWGVVTGNGTFLTASTNYGTVEGDGIFGTAGGDDYANNVGTVEGNAIFRGHAFNVGTVDGNAEFEDDATNSDATGYPAVVGGNAEFSDRAKNLGDGSVNGNATFNDDSENIGTVNGNATFNGLSINTTDGFISGNATFNGTAFDGTRNEGQVEGDATFNGESYNAGGYVGGNATFNDTSQNIYFAGGWNSQGYVEGDATFNESSVNDATVQGFGTFNGDSSMLSGEVQGGAEFNGNSFNNMGSVGIAGSGVGDATFNDDSKNKSLGRVEGTATFNDNSENDGGIVYGDATFNNDAINKQGNVYGDATFNNNSSNATASAVFENAVFNNDATNYGDIEGNAEFNGGSTNEASGTVSENATFNGTSRNIGSVVGTATFNDGSCNSGTAGTFIPDPPNPCN